MPPSVDQSQTGTSANGQGGVASGPQSAPPNPAQSLAPPDLPNQAAEAHTPPPPTNPNTTQNTLLFSEIRDNMVVMNDGSFRAVVSCKSINFDLMSSKEREGIEYSYQNFLNSLTFPVQILIRSQRVDIGPYIERLTNIRRDQENMLLNVMTDDYIDFIDTLSQEANIMDKSFYVVVPYWPHGDVDSLKRSSKSLFGTIFGGTPKQRSIVINHEQYEKALDEIKNHVDAVMNGLFQLGVKCVQLNTKELGRLYYNFYNPDTSVREPLGDFSSVTAMYVKKGEGEAPKPHLIRDQDKEQEQQNG